MKRRNRISTTHATDYDWRQTAFVGREAELRQLHTFLDRTLAGHSQIIFITGEAGSGKSALVQAFQQRAQTRHLRLIAAGGQCNAFTGIGDPYLPFAQILTSLTGDLQSRGLPAPLGQMQHERLTALLPETVQALVDHGPTLLTTLLDGQSLLAHIERNGTIHQSLYVQVKSLLAKDQMSSSPDAVTQQRLFAEVTRVLQALVQHRPLLLVLDDLQWADLGSLNLLFHLSRALTDVPILITGIYRDSDVALGRNGERHPLLAVVNELQRRFGDLRINLGQTSTPAFVDDLLDTIPNRFTVEFRRAFYQQTRGHPLFSVELLRGLQERGDLVQDMKGVWIAGKALDWTLLPARIEGCIAERIDRLPASLQRMLAVAAIEGKQFTAEIVAFILKIELQTLVDHFSSELDRQHHLVAGVGVQWIAGQRLTRFRFRHALFQQYLYAKADVATRAVLHEAIAQQLEARYETVPNELAVHLAFHYQKTGALPQTIHYLEQAGKYAMQLGALEAANTHIVTALALLESSPKTHFLPINHARNRRFLYS